MRIVSFLPAATETLFAVGAGPEVVGVSHECDWPEAARRLPRVTGTIVDVDAPSRAIDEQVSGALKEGRSIYTVDQALLSKLQPELVVTQQLCEVCAITPTGINEALAGVRPAPELLSLHPHSIAEIFDDVRAVGRVTGRTAEAGRYVDGLQRRLDLVRTAVEELERPRVYCMEWLDPPYNAGHWVPEQVRIAGGEDGLGRLGTDSVRLLWEAICEYDPEVLVLMPCGLSMERMEREVRELFDERWAGLAAVKNNRVWGVNGPAYFNNSGPRVVDGAELLVSIFHPETAPLRKFGPRDVRRIDLRQLIPA
jgi:iron complex transport system substrate-binding protein